MPSGHFRTERMREVVERERSERGDSHPGHHLFCPSKFQAPHHQQAPIGRGGSLTREGKHASGAFCTERGVAERERSERGNSHPGHHSVPPLSKGTP